MQVLHATHGGQKERVEGTVNKHGALLVYVGVFQGGFGKISHGRQPATCAGCDSETLPISPQMGEITASSFDV